MAHGKRNDPAVWHHELCVQAWIQLSNGDLQQIVVVAKEMARVDGGKWQDHLAKLQGIFKPTP